MRYFRASIIILLFAFIGIQLVHTLTSINQDIGRHLKMGEIIWSTKSVPSTNLFSFTQPNTPFINHHWLGEVFFYLLNGIIGLKGLILAKAVFITAALGLIFWALYKKAGFWPLAVSSLIAIIVFDRTDVRPEIFSYLFMAIFLVAIFNAKYHDRAGNKNYKWLYVLPFIQLLWTNTHIYFALGPGLILFFLIDRIIHEEDRAVIKKIFIFFLIVSGTTLINPNFIRGALEPFMILRDYGYDIVENQSIFFLTDYGILRTTINLFEISLIVLLLSFVIALGNGARKITFELLTAMFFSLMGIEMIRNLGIYSLMFAFVAGLNFSYYHPPAWLANKKTNYILLAVSGLLLVWLIPSVINNRYFVWLARRERFGLIIPAGASDGVKFVKENKIQGPVFNNFDVGSFLIWKLYPEQKVFVDGRPEAYTYDFLQHTYVDMMGYPEIWKTKSEQYGINYIFLDRNDITPWAKTFLNSLDLRKWPLVYKDGSVLIFLKNTPQNQAVIDKYRISPVL